MADIGKRALVTGAARGLGRSIVETLAAAGWEVWACDVRAPDDGLPEAHAFRVVDVTDESAVTAVFEEMETHGGVDGLVNNAAIFPAGAWDELDIDSWRRTIETNLIGSYLCAREAGKSMRKHGRGGSIVNLGSVTFHAGMANGIIYTTTKGAVVAMTRSMARAVGSLSVRVNCVAPGLMDTEGVREQMNVAGVDHSRLSGQDPQRILPGITQTDGVANVIAFLLSEHSKEITGQTIIASGGTYL